MKDEYLGFDPFEQDYEPDLITLADENGEEHVFEVLDATEIGLHRYLAMVPYHSNPAERLAEDAEMLIMRLGEEGGEEYLDIVQDDDELHEAGQVFYTRLSEVYNIDMEELEQQMRREEGWHNKD